MAAHPILIVDDELLERLPEPFRTDPRYQKGTSLELVPLLMKEDRPVDGAKGDWRRLRGILADSDFDPNAELEAERLRELESEARWLKT